MLVTANVVFFPAEPSFMPTTVREPTIDDVLAFHQTLVQLQSAGIPILSSDRSSSRTLDEELKLAATRLATELGRGKTLGQAIESAPDLPAKYRRALAAWLLCGPAPEVLEQLSSDTHSQQQIESQISASMIQPVILLVLTYFGVMILIFITVPTIEALYVQQRETPGTMLQWLEVIRAAFPIWGSLIPILLVIGLVAWQWKKSAIVRAVLPGMERSRTQLQTAAAATELAHALDESAQPQTISLLANIDETPSGSQASLLKTEESRDAASATRIDLQLAGFNQSPLMQWALTADSGSPSPSALRFVAKLKRHEATNFSIVTSFWGPIILSTLLGGVVVLLYGIAMFTPLIELLFRLPHFQELGR